MDTDTVARIRVQGDEVIVGCHAGNTSGGVGLGLRIVVQGFGGVSGFGGDLGRG